jgi:hypothetical protein
MPSEGALLPVSSPVPRSWSVLPGRSSSPFRQGIVILLRPAAPSTSSALAQLSRSYAGSHASHSRTDTYYWHDRHPAFDGLPLRAALAAAALDAQARVTRPGMRRVDGRPDPSGCHRRRAPAIGGHSCWCAADSLPRERPAGLPRSRPVAYSSWSACSTGHHGHRPFTSTFRMALNWEADSPGFGRMSFAVLPCSSRVVLGETPRKHALVEAAGRWSHSPLEAPP